MNLDTLIEAQVEAHERLETPEFQSFGKIPRLRREIIVTEKIDGTNAQLLITEDGRLFAGSRTRWITPGKGTDNFGFAAWAYERKDDLVALLGAGRHFGEWYGSGIQRGYGMQNGERRFALFNVSRWGAPEERDRLLLAGLDVVPVLYRGPGDMYSAAESAIVELMLGGSRIVPGYMNPEGVVVFHAAGGHLYKQTIVGDDEPKTKAKREREQDLFKPEAREARG